MNTPHPITGRTINRAIHNTYTYNPDCGCPICTNNGQIPQDHPETGHSFCYEQPHIPPTTRSNNPCR